MKPFVHPSERSLASHSFDLPGRYIAQGQRCACLSESSAATTDQRATATDNARAQSGSHNVQATDGGTVNTVKGNVTAGNVTAEKGATVTVGIQPADVGSLVDKLTAANRDVIAQVVESIKQPPAAPVAPADSATAADAAGMDTNTKIAAVVLLGLGALYLTSK